MDSRLAKRDDRLVGMEVRSTVMIWTVGINANEGHAVVAIVQLFCPRWRGSDARHLDTRQSGTVALSAERLRRVGVGNRSRAPPVPWPYAGFGDGG
jgi:hypothetical protein